MVDGDMEALIEELLQCRRCGICREAVYERGGFDGVCPVWENSAGFETSFMRGKMIVALALLEGRLERSAACAESLYTCTLCGNCTQICGAEFDPAHTLETVRAVLSDIPNPVRDRVTADIMAHNNPYVDDNTEKRAWTARLDFDVPTEGEVLYFVGCTAGIRVPETAIATARILHSAGIDFCVVEDEPCCGSVMMRTGAVDSAHENAARVIEAVERAGAERIVVSCAGCLKALRKDFPEALGTRLPEVVHVVGLVQQLIAEGRLTPHDTGEHLSVTYHDPCHMGRELGIYDAPREVMGALPGVELVEMATTRAAAKCCGAGGGLRSFDPGLSERIATARVNEALATGADILATACPFCVSNLQRGATGASGSVKVVDIVQLVVERLR